MHSAALLYDASSHRLCFFNLEMCATLSQSDITHQRNVLLPGFSPLHPFIPTTALRAVQHMKLLALISHFSENDIQFTEISLLHRRHRQSGLVAEIDASCPRPPSKYMRPTPQSHLEMKQQLTPYRYS